MFRTQEEMKKEAVTRMNRVHISKQIIKDFEEGQVTMSENGGFLYWLDDGQMADVLEFNRKNRCIVYHVIHDWTEFGELLTYLFVTEDDEYWDEESLDIDSGVTFAYVKNLTNDMLSEFGYIGFMPRIGGLVRTA